MSTPTEAPPRISIEHIVMTPGTCSGRPRIAGTRIKVKHVVIWHEQMRMSPGQIVADYPHLTLADVYAALTYYYDHREQIETEIRDDDAFAEELRASGPSIIEKWGQLLGPDNSLPPG
jgi:uncharacterized protein (DUF433 family)